ncbi:hypothetical protein JOB18_004288 [Solea senegalensis]|uniref:Uncharacterized protein n=1 Tax=Solea senegalensis TaxID=28829 RepID=A0AAV6T3H9_SOLSE|nr:hypothetical protein JOB18_004288 [Solea senegalensis]
MATQHFLSTSNPSLIHHKVQTFVSAGVLALASRGCSGSEVGRQRSPPRPWGQLFKGFTAVHETKAPHTCQ